MTFLVRTFLVAPTLIIALKGPKARASLQRAEARVDSKVLPIISMNSDPFIERKGTFDSLATALASMVLPQPGGPVNRAPLGGLAPSSRYFSGCFR